MCDYDVIPVYAGTSFLLDDICSVQNQSGLVFALKIRFSDNQWTDIVNDLNRPK